MDHGRALPTGREDIFRNYFEDTGAFIAGQTNAFKFRNS
jgi:hypothetical protein